MPRIIRLRRHSIKAIQDSPTGLSHEGVKKALDKGKFLSRRSRFFASAQKRAQATAELLGRRGFFGRKKPVQVVPGIAFEAWPESVMSTMDLATREMENRLKLRDAEHAKDRAETHFAVAWIRGYLKDAIVEELIGKEPKYSDRKYHPRRPEFGFDGRVEFRKDHAFYSKRKKVLEEKMEGIPKSSDVGKTIVQNAIIPNLPERGVWKFFGKMIRPWKWFKRVPKRVEIVTHSYNIEAVLQYLTGKIFTDFPPTEGTTQIVSELEPIEFKVTGAFKKKITLVYRAGKPIDITAQINALQKQM